MNQLPPLPPPPSIEPRPDGVAALQAAIPALQRYALVLLRDRQGVDDLVHDCLVQALSNMRNWRYGADIRPWLFSIMHNQFISEKRRERTRGQNIPIETLIDIGADSRMSIEATQEDRLRWRDLLRGLNELPLELRLVITLVSVEELTYAAVAEILGIPIGTVMSRLSRGRERLRQLMGRRGAPHSSESEMSEGNISEDDLHAYVDGRLEASRARQVERYLEQNPAAAARIAAYVAQTHDLRAALKNAVIKPEFAAVTVASRRFAGPGHRLPLWQAAAAAILVGLLIGGGGGWMIRGNMAPAPLTGIPALTQEAVANHIVFTEDHGRPVELTADKQADLVRWLTKRLDTHVIIPDLTSAGYQFMGGRLAATDHGPAAMLMYVDASGRRLTIFTRPMRRDKKQMTVPIGADGVRGFAWICDGQGYSVLETSDSGSLQSVAAIIRHQVDPS